MQARWLGWAGVEIEARGGAVVIDPLKEPDAMYAALGDAASDAPLPDVVAPSRAGTAVAGLLTHLHRDHADADALRAALAPGAPVLEPPPTSGDGLEDLGLAQADAELSSSGLQRRCIAAWETVEISPFSLTALPAVDGSGDPQVAWLVEAEGCRILHLGDTLFHGLVADGIAARAIRRRLRSDQRASDRFPAPAARESASRGDGSRASGDRRRSTRRTDRRFRSIANSSEARWPASCATLV